MHPARLEAAPFAFGPYLNGRQPSDFQSENPGPQNGRYTVSDRTSYAPAALNPGHLSHDS